MGDVGVHQALALVEERLLSNFPRTIIPNNPKVDIFSFLGVLVSRNLIGFVRAFAEALIFSGQSTWILLNSEVKDP